MQEAHYNSREQVVAYLAGALAVVDELDPPADLREPAFVKAVELLSAKQVFLEQADTSPIVRPRRLN